MCSNVCCNISYICAASDINECDLSTHNCSNNAECYNTNGSFVCNCSDGFSGNGVICEGMQTIKFFLVYLGTIERTFEESIVGRVYIWSHWVSL